MKQCYCKDSYVKISWFEGSGYDFVEASSRMADYAPHRIYLSLIHISEELLLHSDASSGRLEHARTLLKTLGLYAYKDTHVSLIHI